jgi:hypothetical protein
VIPQASPIFLPVDRLQRMGGLAQPVFPGNSCLPSKGGFRFLGFYGLRAARGAPSGFTIRRLAIARGNQFFLELRPFVDRHGGLFALRRQIFYREINACFRKRRCLSPRVHQ